MRTRGFLLTGLLVALLLAGGGSYYASTHPDGLEFVADKAGFAGSARESPTSGSPLAGYATEGVADDRVGGGIAGVVGALTVLLLAGGLFRVLRGGGPDRAGTELAGGADSHPDSHTDSHIDNHTDSRT